MLVYSQLSGAPMRLQDYLPASHIIKNLQNTNKIEIIEELLQQMQKLNLLTDYDLALNDTLNRESYLSTGLENGLAIPHAKTDAINELAMVFGRTVDGVDFQSLDGKPAHLIFLVLSPRNVSGPHIQALAVISRNIKESAIRDQIVQANSADEIADIIKAFH
jgi:fructose-specific phosphotransferase system IIA component